MNYFSGVSGFYLGYVLFTSHIVSMLAFRSIASKTVSCAARTMSSSSSNNIVVKNMNVIEFNKILNGQDRSKYQIIDVREPNELEVVKLSGADVINLPLRDADNWSQKVINGQLLDNEKPTLCMCHHGMRSMKVANFLGESCLFFLSCCV